MGAIDFDWIGPFVVSEGPTDRYPDTITRFPVGTKNSKTGYLEAEHQKSEINGFYRQVGKSSRTQTLYGSFQLRWQFSFTGPI